MHTVNKNKQRYYRIEHAGHKSKSGQPVRWYSTSGTLFLLFVQQKCQNIAGISNISLGDWCIKYGAIKQLKNCFNLTYKA